MKIIGILSIGLLGAIVAAVQKLYSGAGLWAALVGYVGVGLAFTLLGALILVLHSLVSSRPFPKAVMGPAVSGASD